MTKIKGSKVAPTGTLPAKRQAMSINSRRWYALAVVLAAVFLAAFDFNVVTIAIPSIQARAGDELRRDPADRGRVRAVVRRIADYGRSSGRSLRAPADVRG